MFFGVSGRCKVESKSQPATLTFAPTSEEVASHIDSPPSVTAPAPKENASTVDCPFPVQPKAPATITSAFKPSMARDVDVLLEDKELLISILGLALVEQTETMEVVPTEASVQQGLLALASTWVWILKWV